jgi:hypothetical protein
LNFERDFPVLLKKLHKAPFDSAGGQEVEFEPYSKFLSAEDTADWIRAWTGNRELDGREFRIFGQDGSGGYAAIWLASPGAPLLEQPIVFMGSEGECGVVAADFADYLWLLAGGFGPMEAVANPDAVRTPVPRFARFAAEHSPDRRKPPSEVLAAARAAHPNFTDAIKALCR